MTINAANRSLVIAASADGVLWSQYPAGDKPIAPATRNILYEGTWDTGLIAASGQMLNGGNINAMRDTGYVDGNSQFPNGGAGGYGPSIDSDLRLVASEVVGGETILPRKGSYFLRGAMYYNKVQDGSFAPGFKKDYNILSGGVVGDIYGSNDKPRWNIGYPSAAYLTDYDTEWWAGFSIRLPLNWSHDDPNAANQSANMLISMTGQDTNATQITFSIRGRQLNVSSNWALEYSVNPTSVLEGQPGGTTTKVNFPCDDDVGKWTDFVLRVRFNPFSVDTNPFLAGVPNSRNQLYLANKGILELWKQVGPGRVMTKVFSQVNAPMGLVAHATRKIDFYIRNYKYGWKKIPTQAASPVWMGFDEIRFGGTIANGTSFSDVDVDQRVMP